MLPKGFLELARTLIGANTVSSQGTRQAADLLQALWEHAGLPVRRQVVEEVHVNILGGPGFEVTGEGGLLLVTHLDTVPPGPLERWRSDPWTLTERDGFLHGLGVADVKLDALCKAEAARRVQGRKARRPFSLLGTFGEEVGLRGARHFVESDLARQIAPTRVLGGGPGRALAADASPRKRPALRPSRRRRRPERARRRRRRRLHPARRAPLARARPRCSRRPIPGRGAGLGGRARRGRSRAADLD